MTQRESGHSKPRHLFDAERQAIRFRLTLLLGLSLFNAIIALLLTVTPLRFIADAPSEEVIRHCRSTAVLVDTAYGQALTAISRPTPQTLADISSTLDQVEGKLAALEDSGALQQDLQLYRQATEDWMEMLIAAPDAVQAAESEAGQQLLGELKIQHYRLASGLALMMDIALPRWADVVLAQARWVILWLIFSALLTVSLVFELRSLTQKPLLTLRSAALKVAAGDLEAPIPVPGRASEIRSLARSIDAMRARLVRSIRDLDIQNREMELILENMTDGVLLMDAAGRIQEINPQGVQVLHSMSGSIPCEGDRTIGLIPDLTAELLVAEAPAELTVSYAEGSGKQRWVQVSLRVVPGSEGREPVWVLVLRDTTHEQELEQLQRDFLSVVTHELKTPLTAIQGYAGLLARGMGASLSARREQFARRGVAAGSPHHHGVVLGAFGAHGGFHFFEGGHRAGDGLQTPQGCAKLGEQPLVGVVGRFAGGVQQGDAGFGLLGQVQRHPQRLRVVGAAAHRQQNALDLVPVGGVPLASDDQVAGQAV